jgi:hypothetical protein
MAVGVDDYLTRASVRGLPHGRKAILDDSHLETVGWNFGMLRRGGWTQRAGAGLRQKGSRLSRGRHQHPFAPKWVPAPLVDSFSNLGCLVAGRWLPVIAIEVNASSIALPEMLPLRQLRSRFFQEASPDGWILACFRFRR